MSNNSTVDYYVAPRKSFEATADAIRTVNGSTASLVWGQDGFANSLSSQRMWTGDNIATRNFDYKDIILAPGTTSISSYAFYNSKITSITGENVTTPGNSMFRYSTVVSVNFPKLTGFGSDGFRNCTSITQIHFDKVTTATNYGFQDCTGLTSVVLPICNDFTASSFNGCSNLEIVDAKMGFLRISCFANCTKLTTLIIRNTSVANLVVTGALSNTPFAQGGTGGTIYIPQTLYNALGTGTNDYKAQTNWAVIDAYGTITWAKIEGSYYETHYADGTTIPTT